MLLFKIVLRLSHESLALEIGQPLPLRLKIKLPYLTLEVIYT